MGGDDATILVVDDEPPVTDLYADILTHTYTVETVYNGAAALNMEHERFDGIVLDRRMPDHSGDTVTTHLRNEGFDGPIVMVSAVQPDTDLFGLRIDEYLTKPVGFDALTDAVHRSLTVTTMDESVREYVRLLDLVLAVQDQYAQPTGDAADTLAEATDRLDDLSNDVEPAVDDEVREVVEAVIGKWPNARVDPSILVGALSRDPA